MTYKLNIFLNRIPASYNFMDDFKKAQAYHYKHGVLWLPTFHTVDIHGYTSVFNTTKNRWLISGVEQLLQTDSTFDANMFVFDQAEWSNPVGSQYPLKPDTPSGSCITDISKPFICIGTYPTEHANGQTWIQIAHEMMHSYIQNARLKGIIIQDQMDTYDHNSDPNYPTGNFAIQWQLLSNYLQPMRTLKKGDTGDDVKTLQTLLNQNGVHLTVDGGFGSRTLAAVMTFQNGHGLVGDGIVGMLTWQALYNATSPIGESKLDKWCEAIKDMEGAKPERNNPGNLEFHGQQYAVADGRFCKFDTYQHGYDALKSLLTRACSGQINPPYNPNGNLYDFYAVYSPSSDGNNPKNYAEFVAKRIGVDPHIIIRTLLN